MISNTVLRWLTAGESHGPQLTVIVEGLPAGLELTADDLRSDLRRRQGGHGRGGRQQIEVDEARILGGVRGGLTIGSPVALVLENRDHANWTGQMTPGTEGYAPKPVTRLRPGHADLAGVLKYGHDDVRNVLERSSARETAARVAAGGIARKLLSRFGLRVFSFTQSIGPVDIGYDAVDPEALTEEEIENSPVRCPLVGASATMVAEIDAAGRHPRRRFPRAGALEHIADVVVAVLEHPRQVGVAGSQTGDRLWRVALGAGRHLLGPVGVVAILEHERDGAADRQATADAAQDAGFVHLDLLSATPAVAALAAAEVAAQVVGRELQSRWKPFDDDGELGAMRLPGGEPAQHSVGDHRSGASHRRRRSGRRPAARKQDGDTESTRGS